MSNSAIVNFDTEFRVPPDCLREGDVDCRVVKADCVVVDTWGEWVTFKVRLLLKIRIQSGELVCTFFKELVFRETVWLDCNTFITDCKVVAAACKCVVHRGKVHCNLTVKVCFRLKKKFKPDCCCKKHDCCCDDWSGHDWSGHDWCHDDWSGSDCCTVERRHHHHDPCKRPKKQRVCGQPVIVKTFSC
ncbi:MAG: hypothetical protein ACOY94_07325 [Bacillota bacterium]